MTTMKLLIAMRNGKTESILMTVKEYLMRRERVSRILRLLMKRSLGSVTYAAYLN